MCNQPMMFRNAARILARNKSGDYSCLSLKKRNYHQNIIAFFSTYPLCVPFDFFPNPKRHDVKVKHHKQNRVFDLMWSEERVSPELSKLV